VPSRLAAAVVALSCVIASGAHAQGAGAASFTLVKQDAAARGGTVQVRSTGSGLVIAGVVDGPAPRWPTAAAALERGEHIDIWIADVAPPRLPPIGWGHQFGFEYLTREDDCLARDDTTAATRAHCVDWFRRQAHIRPAVTRLFTRRWSVAPSLVVETFARPAFASLDTSAQRALEALAPVASREPPRAGFTPAARGYAFAVTVPWSALPPVQSTSLSELRIVVDVYGASAASVATRSSTAPAANAGDPATFPIVPLSAPREYRITPCQATLSDPVIQNGAGVSPLGASDSAVVYIRPSAALDLRQAVVLDDLAQGYQYEPDSSTTSPVAHVAHYWAVPLGSGEMLCGPHLAYLRAAGVTRSDAVVDVADSLTTRRLANGDLLVKAGPRVFYSYYGSGQCGACPRVSLDVHHLDQASGAITPAFSHFDVAEPDFRDVDIAVTPDWREITIFESSTTFDATPVTTWRSTTHCYRAPRHVYEECGHRDLPGPPPRRHLRFPEERDRIDR
jgi:hypothetical protein